MATLVSLQSPKTYRSRSVGDFKLPVVVSERVKGVCFIHGVFPALIYNGWLDSCHHISLVHLISCLSQRKALVVVFQHWFSVAAEEASVASRLALYLREVRKVTPSLLAFLVNLADDNGNTVLHYSVSHCNYSIVSLLLDTGNSAASPEVLYTTPGCLKML